MPIIGYCQFEPHFGERDANLAALASLLPGAGAADLVCCPELCVSGYELRDRAEVAALAEPFPDGPTSRFAARLARERGCTLVVGYPERAGDRLYNACVLATPDGRLASYRKAHLFGREKARFDPGDGPPRVVDTPAGRVGPIICFDWAFPELSRGLALDGAQILVQPANLVLDLAQRVMVARSIENGVYSITANRIGAEDRAGRLVRFTGASQVVGPRGEVLARAPSDAPHVGLVEVDLARADDKRVTEENDLLADRRPELYGRGAR